ncbi:chemotaxis protein CheX [Nocardioides bruguierae]|uniref:chemotaxis protein CheX n=1 Tax=Nocardioides bruguierae TaxID=2945102 RepID=UPI002020294F|nr:chemotaxis protein CheX [Nocardioides bruguierae]MCL8027656.1 chemotaxis protein CheX [Nocardioides bruguierae]
MTTTDAPADALGSTPAAVSVEDLQQIADDVWATFLDAGDVPPPGDDAGTDAGADPETDAVHSAIAVLGSWEGQVVVECSRTAAERMARQMLMVTDVTPADLDDTVGELVNVVGGNVKSLVPAPSSLGLPVTEAGRWVAGGAAPVCSVHLDWAGHPVTVSVWSAA